jgi:hypothetical protein
MQNHLNPDHTSMSGGFAAWENLGMQWLVLGMAPGIDFISGHSTRREAQEALAEYDGKTHDYFAIVKARDFYAAP